jgi:large subunit ribosomal protein L30
MKQVEEKKITIKYKKSVIKQPKSQKKIVQALGFRKLNQVLVKNLNPSLQGMLRKVAHLVAIEE